jgi:hypothetical protein
MPVFAWLGQSLCQLARLFCRPKDQPLKVFDFDSRSFSEVFGTMLDDNNPTERCARKKDKPKK